MDKLYIDLLPKDLRYELFMYIPLLDIIPNLSYYKASYPALPIAYSGGIKPKFTLQYYASDKPPLIIAPFYENYLNKDFWIKRIMYLTKLPKIAFVDFLNDNDSTSVKFFRRKCQSRS